MIDVIQDVIARVGSVGALAGKVYRKWPQTRAQAPYAVVDRVGRSMVLTDTDGSEVIASLSYAVDIMASSPSELDDLESAVSDALAGINFHSTGSSPMWESSTKLYRRSLTFEGVVDRRGSTFTQ